MVQVQDQLVLLIILAQDLSKEHGSREALKTLLQGSSSSPDD